MIDSITLAMNEVAKYIIPLLLIGFPLYGLGVKKVRDSVTVRISIAGIRHERQYLDPVSHSVHV